MLSHMTVSFRRHMHTTGKSYSQAKPRKQHDKPWPLSSLSHPEKKKYVCTQIDLTASTNSPTRRSRPSINGQATVEQKSDSIPCACARARPVSRALLQPLPLTETFLTICARKTISALAYLLCAQASFLCSPYHMRSQWLFWAVILHQPNPWLIALSVSWDGKVQH